MGEEFSFEDALIILRRRVWYFLIPFVVIAPLGIIVVMLMPAMYRAEGTILVESQQIPDELVRSTINAYAQERIQTIRQRVMTLNRVNEVAAKHNVFPEGSRLSESERARKMREQMNVSLITVERRGRSGDGTIAFTVSFRHRDPRTAHLVANEFMTLFLAEDVRTRTAGASNTTEFFEREAAKLRNEVASIERRISEFKTENSNALPEHLSMHIDMLERANREFVTLERTNEALEEEKQFLAAQLISGSRSENGLTGQLVALETQLARLRATYRDGYPEIEAVKVEIAALKRQLAPSPEIQRLRTALADADARLTELEREATPDTEAVDAAVLEVEAARQALSDQISKESREGANDPSSAQTESRIAIIDNRIRMNQRRKDALNGRVEDLQLRIARTPAVERELAALTRDYDNMDREYQEVRAKQQDAQLAENLEANQQAEKFSILEPAQRPDQPSSPDRPKMIILSLFAALGAGGAAAVLAELLIATVRGRTHLSNITGEHPIAVVPYIQNEDDRFSLFGLFKRRHSNAPSGLQEA